VKAFTWVLSVLFVLASQSIGSAQTPQKKALTLEGAKQVIAAAVAEGKSKRGSERHAALVQGSQRPHQLLRRQSQIS
jgi:hypothetical protein